MCLICDGFSEDEIHFRTFGHIEKYGCSIVAVEADTPSRSWAYSIGLSASFGHPELAVVGLRDRIAGRLIRAATDLIRDGRRLCVGESIVAPSRLRYRVGEVHPDHYNEMNTFASWMQYFSALGPPYPEMHFLELSPWGRRPRLSRGGPKEDLHRQPGPKPPSWFRKF